MAKKTDKTIKFFVVVIGLAVIGYVLKELSHIFIPLVIAYFLYFVFNPLNNFFQHKKVPLFIIIILDLAITIFLAWGTFRLVFESFANFTERLPFYGEKLSSMVQNAAVSFGINDPFYTNFSFNKLLAELDYQSLAGGLFTSTVSLTGSLLFILFFFVFVVSGQENIYEAIKKNYVTKRVKPELKKIRKHYAGVDPKTTIDERISSERLEKEKKLSSTFKAITEQIQRYIIAKIGVNLLAGVSVSIILSLFGVEFPIVWGLFTFLFNFIPTIGSAIALVLPTLMVIIQFESASYAVIILIIIAVIQTLFFNVLEPIIIGRRLNLNPLLILFMLLIWGYIWGVPGMLLSVPLTAIIKIIISNSESKNLKFLTDVLSNG